MTDFFPPADVTEAPTEVSVPLASVVRVMTCEDSRVAFGVAVENGEAFSTIYRFTVPDHSRLARRVFREARIQTTRTRESYTISSGAFLISISGIRVGTDLVPEGASLHEIVVLDKVVVHETCSRSS